MLPCPSILFFLSVRAISYLCVFLWTAWVGNYVNLFSSVQACSNSLHRKSSALRWVTSMFCASLVVSLNICKEISVFIRLIRTHWARVCRIRQSQRVNTTGLRRLSNASTVHLNSAMLRYLLKLILSSRYNYIAAWVYGIISRQPCKT